MKVKKIKPAYIDDRGEIADIFYKSRIDHVGIISSVKGSLRGDHYHKKTTQHMYITKGSLRYYYRKLEENSEIKSIIIKKGDLITTPPLEVHSLEILEANIFIVFSEGLRGGEDYESDTFRVSQSLFPQKILSKNYIDLRNKLKFDSLE